MKHPISNTELVPKWGKDLKVIEDNKPVELLAYHLALNNIIRFHNLKLPLQTQEIDSEAEHSFWNTDNLKRKKYYFEKYKCK